VGLTREEKRSDMVLCREKGGKGKPFSREARRISRGKRKTKKRGCSLHQIGKKGVGRRGKDS